MNLKPHIVDQIKEQIDIVDVLGDFISLKKVGQNYRALSPFTNEKTPSFYVSPSKGIFKDFSSGKGGDAISFIMELEGLTYPEAIVYLGKKYGIELEEEEVTPEEVQHRNDRESLFIVLNYACQYFKELLWNSEEGKSIGLSYFRERGFTDQVIKAFDLGYCDKGWDGLLKRSKKDGHSEEWLEKAGLIIKKENKIYDRFRGRVVFPIHNITGKPIAFGARILVNDKKQPKYINSPETDVYNKSSVLYGMHQAKQSIRNLDNCYLVEGYTDVISMHMSEVTNVVSSSGTSLTDDQIKLISRYTNNITVLFDGDAAGVRASLRGVDMILEQGMNVKVVAFPEGEDPDSYSGKLGSSGFQQFLQENAQDFIKFKIDLFAKEAAGDPVKKAETIKNIVESITKIPDPIKRSVYLQESSKLMDIDESILISEQNKILIKKHKESRKPSIQNEDGPRFLEEQIRDNEAEKAELLSTDTQIWQEKETIRILLAYGVQEVGEEVRLHQYIFDELSDIEFKTPVYKEILNEYKSQMNNGDIPDARYFIEKGSEEVRQEVISLTTEKYEISQNWHDMYQIYVPQESEILDNLAFTNVHRLKLRVIQKLIDGHLENLKQENDPKKQEEIMSIIQSYKQIEMELAKVLGNIVAR